jgi:nitrate/nitrite transport system ATP-binding protein
MSYLEIKSAHKGFGTARQRTEILTDLNLQVTEGEFVVIIGYSGSGKTTLMNLLSGLSLPDSGSVSIGGQAITGPSPERALVFQNYSLLPWLTVFENIGLAVESVFPNLGAAERAAKIAHYIEMVNLTPATHKFPRELSGGMKQRVSVARALAMEPKVLLLDEPLSALDALTRANLQDEISQIRASSGATIVWITNDPDEAILLADRVIPLTPGPPSTLGPSMTIGLAQPRDRKTILHDPEFKRLRLELTTWLLDEKAKRRTVSETTLTPPDILPEDVTTVNTLPFLIRRAPRRRSDAATTPTQISA